MFCPVGYRSAAELWHEYQDRRLKSVYLAATKAYQRHQKKFLFLRGAPLDICEFLFLSSLSEVGIFLASQHGDIIRVFIRLPDGEHSLFTVLNPYRSATYSAATTLDKAGKGAIKVFGQENFSAWEHDITERDSWIDTYPELSGQEYDYQESYDFPIWHHTLPCHFVRRSFLIADTVPLWAVDQAIDAEVKPLLDHFSGWSICISEETYQNKWQDYLLGKKPVFANGIATETRPARGRPGLEAARAAFAAMGYDKGNLSWAQVQAKIMRETGESPSAKTLRNWRDDNLQGKIVLGTK